MREVVKETTHYFQSEESSCGNEKNAVERAKIYLENHIDQPLSAADVAAALFMNADYLSRSCLKMKAVLRSKNIF